MIMDVFGCYTFLQEGKFVPNPKNSQNDRKTFVNTIKKDILT